MINSGFVYIADYQLPAAARDTYTVVDHLCLDMHLKPDERHKNKTLFNLNLKPGERALITSIYVTYCASDFDTPTKLTLKHEDSVIFVVPARATGAIPRRDQLLFRSRCLSLHPDALAFLGAEYSILNRRSTAIIPETLSGLRDWCFFRMEDPFATFLIRNRGLFKDVTQDDVRMLKQPPLVQIRESAVDRVHRFFERELFPLFTYTTQQHIDFECDGNVITGNNTENYRGIVLQFKCEYHVVTQCVPSFTVAAGEKFN
jgi:hypothetical protein